MRVALVLGIVAAVAAAKEPRARVEFFLRDRKGIKKERFVAAFKKALDEKGLDLKSLPREYAKTIEGSFWYYTSHYWIHRSNKPRFDRKDRDAAAANVSSALGRKVIHDHKAWLALEASSTRHRAYDYQVLCRIAAELLGDDVLAIRIPERKAWFAPTEKDLAKRLRAKDPWKALGIAPGAAEQRAIDRQRLLEAASKEARDRFDEFREAFKKRAKTGAKTFRVFHDDAVTGKEELLFVDKVGPDWVDGGLLPKKRVYVRDIVDWAYSIGKNRYGDFRVRAIQDYLKKNPPK
ncbi:MAG: hypothetical protein ACYTGN_14635 [Planctomycetota bacterium]|jgi:hypothetical protein